MKFVSKFLLVILTIPVFLFFVLSINLRFQFMSSDFWINTFAKANVYSQVSEVIDNKMISKVEAVGGRDTDVTVLSDFISPLNLKEFFEKNITSLLLYANNNSSEIVVFIPLSLRNVQNVSNSDKQDSLSEQIKLSDFIDEFNITGINEADILAISKLGFWSWLFTGVSFFLLILLFILQYLLIGRGRRLTIVAISTILSGLILLVAAGAGKVASVILSQEFSSSTNIGTLFAVIFTPPIIREVVFFWLWISIVAIVFGILLFFIKKPGITKAK